VTLERARPVGSALLYEGYALYPYRASSLKNRKRFDFGVLVPRGCAGAEGDTSSMRTECLVRTPSETASVDVTVRFLHLVERAEAGEAPWHEAVEREVTWEGVSLHEVSEAPASRAFSFDGSVETTGSSGSSRRRSEEVHGSLWAGVERDGPSFSRLSVEIRNETPEPAVSRPREREAILLASLVSTHTVLCVRGGEFVSLLDPPDDARGAAERCRNVGTWPVLVGDPWERDTVLSSPIILYDHPRIAPESAGDLFDATEIDEILTLRVLTLTDEEKRQVAGGDPRVRALLARVEGLDESALARLHGALRRKEQRTLRQGDHVRLKPQRRADLFDIALTGKAATVVSVEQDFEGRAYVTVTVDDDPGADLGVNGQPGHRFFFHPEEVELLQ
jgi:hypothetical protein